jgi:hypothetical protein
VDLPVADGAPAGEVRAGDAVRVGAHDRGAADITAAGPADGRPTDQVRPDHGEAEPLPPDPEPGDPGSAARTVAPVAELSSRLPAVLVVPEARSRDTGPDGE